MHIFADYLLVYNTHFLLSNQFMISKVVTYSV